MLLLLLAGFLEKHDAIKAQGVDTIACLATNDAYVMDAWAKDLGATDKILFLSDGDFVFTKAFGLEKEGSSPFVRIKRLSMLVRAEGREGGDSRTSYAQLVWLIRWVCVCVCRVGVAGGGRRGEEAERGDRRAVRRLVGRHHARAAGRRQGLSQIRSP